MTRPGRRPSGPPYLHSVYVTHVPYAQTDTNREQMVPLVAGAND